ncbi:MAG: hypothetical protein ACOYM9_00820 [Bradymonadia bacterium]
MATARKSGFVGLLLFALALVGCGDRDDCVLHSDCARDQRCVTGVCERACDDAFDCPLGRECIGGACVVDVDAARERPCDPDSQSCGDADLVDAQVANAAVPDAAVPDAAVPDAAVPDAAVPDAAPVDAGPPAGDTGLTPLAIDLTGAWAVTKTVELSSDPAFAEDDVTYLIVTLARGAEPDRYALVFIDPAGQRLESVVSIDFRAPNGPLNYQFEYETVPPNAPEGCSQAIRTFQRGEVQDPEGPDLFLVGTEERRLVFAGEACEAEPTTVVSGVRWVLIPVPVPADGGVGDGGVGDGGVGDGGVGDGGVGDGGLGDGGAGDAAVGDGGLDAAAADAGPGLAPDAAPSMPGSAAR